METIKRFTWEVIPTDTPLLKRKCNKCKNSDHYYNSDKFRLNSQKKYIDVWLIYRCVNCDNTYNITILSRTKPDLIDKELFRRFSMNDEETAQKYANDLQTIRRNNMELDYSHIEYDIIRENVILTDILSLDENIVEFEIKAKTELNLKLTAVIRKCLNISLNQLEKMLSYGVIIIHPSGPVRKLRVSDGIVISVRKNRLKAYMESQE